MNKKILFSCFISQKYENQEKVHENVETVASNGEIPNHSGKGHIQNEGHDNLAYHCDASDVNTKL